LPKIKPALSNTPKNAKKNRARRKSSGTLYTSSKTNSKECIFLFSFSLYYSLIQNSRFINPISPSINKPESTHISNEFNHPAKSISSRKS
jgi:hypothetical protein